MNLPTLLTLLRAHARNKLAEARGKHPTPYKWLLQLTNDCNSRCLNCDIWKINKQNPELKAEEVRPSEYSRLLKESGKELLWLALTGGEISQYPHTAQLVEDIRAHCPNLRLITFTTNGIEVDKIVSIAEDFAQLGTDLFVVISLDGDETIHDQTRGIPGNFNLAWKTYESLQARKIRCFFGTTLSARNAGLWSIAIPDALKSISLIHSSGIYAKEIVLDDSAVIPALRKILRNYKVRSLSELGEYVFLRLSLLFLLSARKKPPVQCSVLSSSIHVMPNGSVHGCMYLPSVGNIKEDSLTAILSGDRAGSVREDVRALNCAKCWMNCYAPHSILEHPFRTVGALIRSYLV